MKSSGKVISVPNVGGRLGALKKAAIGGYFAKMMDGWVGKDYEQGLLRLKEHIENMPAATP